jgi:hypothetical protein
MRSAIEGEVEGWKVKVESRNGDPAGLLRRAAARNDRKEKGARKSGRL